MRPVSKNIIYLFILILFSICSCAGPKGGDSVGPDEPNVSITFHDTQLNGGDIRRVDINVVETQIVDPFGKVTTISNGPQSFNLLEVTQNNPVVLAHTKVEPGIYSQIRLILDDKSTITLTDNSRHPLKVPSGQQTGIKLDGVFEIPRGKLFTLDIDLDPNQSFHFTKGQGYMMKPVLKITGTNALTGNFYYFGTYDNGEFVLAIKDDGTIAAIYAKKPNLVFYGTYFHDSVNQTFTLKPDRWSCPSCSTTQTVLLNMFTDIPASTTYNITTFGQDYIELVTPAGLPLSLLRVNEFKINNTVPLKEFVIRTQVDNPDWRGKVLLAQLLPMDKTGKWHYSLMDVPSTGQVDFPFAIEKSDFNTIDKQYILVFILANSRNDFTLSATAVDEVKAYVAYSGQYLPLPLTINRDSKSASPVNVPFIYSQTKFDEFVQSLAQ